MPKIWRLLSTTPSKGQQSLLKKDGIKSDGFKEGDDDSSLSDRGGDKCKYTKCKGGKGKGGGRRIKRVLRLGAEEDGYESDASASSSASTRSTSSSFLKFQSRPKWRNILSSRRVVRRDDDGNEVPLDSNNTKREWPVFSQIYGRQNREGESSDEQEDDEGDVDVGVEVEVELAPPAPVEDAVMAIENDIDPDASLESADVDCATEEMECTQESGISTCEKDAANRSQASAAAGEAAESEDEAAESNEVLALSTPTQHNLSQENPLLDLATAFQATNETTVQPTDEVSQQQYPLQPAATSASKSIQSSSLSSTAKPTKPKSKVPSTSQHSKENIPSNTRKKRPKPTTKQTNDILTPLSIPLTICYSLRSAIGDGSTRQRNSHGLMERRTLRPNGSHLDCSHWSHRGKRSYMEDRFVIEHIGKTSSQPITWLAVFDGHGGAAASQFCSDWLSSYVRKNEFFPDRMALAMETAFTKLDGDFVSSGNLDGSTACACAVIGNSKIICSNAGDSRAIIVKRDGSFVALSQDHKPGRDDETKRINDLGGRVIYWGRWRVEGVLAVSRSIGDAKLKPFVTADPEVVEHEIGEDDMFLVIASDGVWDTMTSDLVAKFVLVNTCKIVNKGLQVDDTLFRWIARQISKRARENGSSDNVSCIVANLKSK